MLKIALISIIFIFWSIAGASVFTNTKEGDSYLLDRFAKIKLQKVKKLNSDDEIMQIVSELLEDEKLTHCSFDFINELGTRFENTSGEKFNKFDFGVLYLARENHLIDDFVLKILKNTTSAVNHNYVSSNYSQDEIDYYNKEKIIAGLKKWQLSNNHGMCLSYSFRELYQVIKTEVGDITSKKLQAWLHYALFKHIISKSEFKLLQMAHFAKVHEWPLTLAAYKEKRKYLLNHFEVNDVGYSSFISSKIPSEGFSFKIMFEENVSYRERLYSYYSPTQMIYMGNAIARLKSRINAMSVVINVLDFDGNVLEEIELTPMEQYRFAAKMVRREIMELKNNQNFSGADINYLDLVTAAFELGEATSEELQFIAEIEYLWNPKISKKDKVLRFVKRYGPICALVLPPGVQHIVPIVLIIVEVMSQEEKNDGAKDDYNLF